MPTAETRDRYLRDPLPIRLGGLAANLCRTASWSDNPLNRKAIASLLEESEYFAEWTAPDAPLDIQEALAELQLTLAIWHRHWTQGKSNPNMGPIAQAWSDRLLALSGLTSV
jgi:hypothetical protein